MTADAPVSWWRLDETAGTTAADARGVNPGAYLGGARLGAASLIADPAGRALGLDGTDDRVRVPDSASLDFTKGFSLEAWVRPAALPPAGQYASIVSKPEAYSLQFSGPRVEFTVIQRGTRRRLRSPENAVAPGAIAHVAGTYDGKVLRLYVNGRLAASKAQAGAASITGQPLLIGAWDGPSELLRGTVDEVAVYRAVLPAARVAAHHAAGRPASARAAVARGKVTRNPRARRVGPVRRSRRLRDPMVATRTFRGRTVRLGCPLDRPARRSR